VRRFLQAAEQRGYATLEELGKVLPEAEEDVGLLDEVFSCFEAHGILVYDDEGKVEEARRHCEPPGMDSAEGRGLLDGIPADDTISLYFREMSQEPLLTHEEEIALAKQIERGDAARQRLDAQELGPKERRDLKRHVQAAEEARARFIRANTRLVVSIAKKYRGHGVPFLDLIQEGNLGLIKAVEKFDYRRGNRFGTYATWWIRQAVSRALPAQSRTIRIPMQMSRRIGRLYRTSQLMQQELGRRPTPEEIGQEMDLDPCKVRFMIQASYRPISLEKPVGEEEDSELGDFIADERIDPPIDTVREELLADQVEEMLDSLTPREAWILCLRFGLQGRPRHTLKEVGKMFGLSKERIRQIQNHALRRLRHPSRARLLRGYL